VDVLVSELLVVPDSVGVGVSEGLGVPVGVSEIETPVGRGVTEGVPV